MSRKKDNNSNNNNNNKGKGEYHAYDATSRSVPLTLCDSLLGDPSSSYSSSSSSSSPSPSFKPIQREEVVVDGARVFLLHGLLSDEECDYLVNATEAIGYDRHSDVANEYPADYRSNQRLIVLSKPLANSLWSRIQPQMHYSDVEGVKPLGWATEGLWLPMHVNDGFLFSRYRKGNFFNPHYDGMYKNEFDECSIYSVTIYLNDNYEGGRVFFMKNKEDRSEENILYTFTPKKGTALIFNHDTLHAGEEVKEGIKYITRTGVMFKHIEDLTDPKKGWEQDPLWIRNKEVFKTFTELGKEGNPQKFTKTFLELQQIQLDHGRSIVPMQKVLLGLSQDLLFHAFSFLPILDVLHLAQVCKSWLTIGRNGVLWRNLYQQMWGEEATKCIQDNISGPVRIDPAIQQWYAIYKKRILIEKTSTPIIVYISFDVIGCRAYGEQTNYIDPFLARVSLGSSPWDNSYETYSVGAGAYWWSQHHNSYDVQVYGELLRAATFRLTKTERLQFVNPHPYVIIYDQNTITSHFNQEVTEKARRYLHCEAIMFVEAAKCALYGKRQPNALVVHLEVPGNLNVSKWINYEKVSEEEFTHALSYYEQPEKPDPVDTAHQIFDLIIECCADDEKNKTVVVIERETKTRVGYFYREILPHLYSLLSKWKVVKCTEKEVLKGASIQAAMPSFQENIHWKSKLFESSFSFSDQQQKMNDYMYEDYESMYCGEREEYEEDKTDRIERMNGDFDPDCEELQEPYY